MLDINQITKFDENPLVDFCPSSFSNIESKKNFKFKIKIALKFFLYGIISGRLFRKKIELPINPKCILITAGGNLGGAIISLPLIKGVRQLWPNAKLVVLCNRKHSIDILKYSGLGDSFYLIPDVSSFNVIFPNKQVKNINRFIKNEAPDIFIGNFNIGIDSILLTFRNIKCTVGQISNSRHDPLRKVFDISVSYDFKHENWLTGYWKLLEALGCSKKEYPFLEVNKQNGYSIFNSKFPSLSLAKVNLIGIQSSVWQEQAYKAYPIEKMARLCEMIWIKLRYIPVIIGSSDQNGLADYIKTYLPHVNFINMVGCLKISELPDFLSLCKCVVANDSGLMHLSAAIKIPTVAIFGMTDPKVSWVYPYNGLNVIVRRKNIVPCFQKNSNVDSFCAKKHCINNISEITIFDQVRKVLDL